MTSTIGVRPDWVSDELFPFESRFMEIDGNVVHYVDEGAGPTILMYHGNPTWSFVYRTVILGLRDRYRCVAFDYPGFGLSSPAPGYGFSIVEHADVSAAFVERLDLTDITLLVQDWGGPIGLGVATREPDRYSRLVIGNTFAWPADKLTWKVASAVLGGLPGRLLVDRFNFLAATVGSVHKRRKLPEEEARHYTMPFPTAVERSRTRQFIAQVTGARSYMTGLANRMPTIADLPTLFFWGTEDSFYKPDDLRRMESLFPNHETHVLDGAGHFIQSEAGPEIAAAVDEWCRRTGPR